jgi:peptidylprolyl isomerase
MAQATDGSTVHIHYTGRLDDGSVFDSSEGRDPLTFTVGSGQVIQGFDAAVRGMEIGDTRTTTIEPAEGYGDRRSELEISYPRAQLPEGMVPEIGQTLQMQTPDGQAFQMRVTEVTDEAIGLDGNHPLAGKTLTFDIELVAID